MHPTGGVTIYPNAWAYVYGSVVDDSLVAHQHRQHRHADCRASDIMESLHVGECFRLLQLGLQPAAFQPPSLMGGG